MSFWSTLVETEDGLKPIEEIEVGDLVLAYDEETGEQAYKKVVRLFRNETKEWYHIFVNGEEIVCTGGHPFYVVGEGFVEAKDLKISDKLLLSSGKCVIIEEVQVEQLATPETTYNFEVADFHTYYVSESNVFVHNKCIFDELGVKDFNEIGSKYKPDELISKLDEMGYSKSVSLKNPNSPATIMTSPNGQYTFRIQSINPQGGTAYFRVFNAGGNPLAANGIFPSSASRAEMRALTHFYFGG